MQTYRRLIIMDLSHPFTPSSLSNAFEVGVSRMEMELMELEYNTANSYLEDTTPTQQYVGMKNERMDSGRRCIGAKYEEKMQQRTEIQSTKVTYDCYLFVTTCVQIHCNYCMHLRFRNLNIFYQLRMSTEV